MGLQAGRMNTILSGFCCIQPYGEKDIAHVQLFIAPDAMEYFFRDLRITHDNVLYLEILKPRGIASLVIGCQFQSVRRETPAELNELWMKKLKIAPLTLDADLLDLSPKFRSRLYESLVSHGWDSSQSMIIATSEDPRLDGRILQGRHRCVIISQILKDGHKFNTSEILIRHEEVSTVDELRAKRAAFEATATLTKDPTMSKKWIASNLNPIIKSHAQQGETKILSYLHDCGFYNDSVALELIDRELDRVEKKRVNKQKEQSHIPDGLKNQSWPRPILSVLGGRRSNFVLGFPSMIDIPPRKHRRNNGGYDPTIEKLWSPT